MWIIMKDNNIETEQKVEEILHKDYKRTLTIEQGLALAVKALRSSIGKDFSPDRIDAAYIKSDKPKFTKLSRQEVERLLKK